MINDNKIKYWFRGELDTSADILDTSTDIAYENRLFDSSDKDFWYLERYQVADEGPAGNQENLKSGLIFFDCVGKRGFGDDTISNNAAEIATIFEPENRKEQVIDATTRIDIDVATTGVGGEYQETDYLIPVRIEFRAYEVT